jgi:EAL domain-containing protein (putative c-di-GMP-specific phosphodiesterase class I)
MHGAAVDGTQEATSLFELERVADVVSGGRLRMVYQPIVELATGRVTGFEALARFDALPRRSPDVWFAHASRAGLGADLEAKAVELALEALDVLAGNLTLAVNVSPRTLCSPELRAVLAAVEPGRLVLEVTEHELVEDYATFNRCAGRLRGRGFRLAVDDAGAGYSDVSRIVEIAPDVVKIDRSLVRSVDLRPRRQAMVATLVAVTDSLRGTTVAEGIESDAEVTALRALGVTHGQGFLFGRPEPLGHPSRFPWL